MDRKIVFVNQATGYLTIDIINKFATEFDEVALITGSIRVQNTILLPEVRVSKIFRYNRGNAVKKAFSWLCGTLQIFWLLRKEYKGFEIIYFTIPPTAYLLAPRISAVYSLIIYDLYPDALKVFGFNEKGFIYKWWSNKNQKIFSKARLIYTLSENMESKILSYSDSRAVKVVSNWSAFTGLNPIAKSKNQILKREGLQGKFVIQYSGNIGMTHKIEILVELAAKLKDYNDIEFVIIGRGDRSKAIEEMIIEKGLPNCRLIPFRKDEELYESLCAADIAVVTLDDKTPDVSVPSKLYNILSAGVPIMAIVPLGSSVAYLVNHHDAGQAFEKEDFTGMAKFILRLKEDKLRLKKLSENSHKASMSYTSSNAGVYLGFYLEREETA